MNIFIRLLNKKSNKGLFVLSLILVLPFFLIIIYANPKYDEFAFIYYIRDGYWSGVDEWLHNENGRYTNALLMCLPVIKNVVLYRLTLALILAAFLHSIYFFSRTVLTLNRSYSFMSVLFFGVLFLFYHPDPNEGFYWYATASHYLISTPLILYLISTFYLSNSLKTDRIDWRLLSLQILLISIIIGTNEMCAIVLTTITILYVLDFNKVSKRLKMEKITLLGTALIFDSIHILLLKQSRLKEGGRMVLDLSLHNLIRSYNEALNSMFGYYQKWLFDDLLILFVLLVTIATVLIRSLNIKIPKPGKKELILGVGLVLSVLLALTAANLSYFPKRALNFIIVPALSPLFIWAYFVGHEISVKVDEFKSHLKYLFITIAVILLFNSPNLTVYQELSNYVLLTDWHQRRDEGHWSVKKMKPMEGLEIEYYTYLKNVRIISTSKDLDLKDYAFFVKPESYYKQQIIPDRVNYLENSNMENTWIDHKLSVLRISQYEKLTLEVYKGRTLCWSHEVEY